MSLTTWLAFAAACIVFSLSPGAGAVSTMSTSLAHGLRPALIGILGLQTEIGRAHV